MRYLCLLMLTSVVAMAQTPAFDAASIKPNVSGGGPSSIRLTPGHVSMQNVSLKKVMLNAYGIQDDREYMIAGPEWLTAEHFDVEAAFPATAQVSAVQQMIQSLLADRFKLVLHKESRDLPNYRLVVAKGGPKISPVEAGASQTSGGAGHFVASKITMQKFADLVARQAGRPVMDETGLSGVFTFSLDWSPAASLRVDSAESGDSSSGPSIFTALQEQLGLKLEPGKGPMDVLVVDRMEKLPTEN